MFLESQILILLPPYVNSLLVRLRFHFFLQSMISLSSLASIKARLA
jgi:hypothetical protein